MKFVGVNQIGESILQDIKKETGSHLSKRLGTPMEPDYASDNDGNIIELSLRYLNEFKSFHRLKELEFLKRIDLYTTEISNIAWLTELKNIEGLNLSNNRIEDITPLRNLKNLTHLNLKQNLIKIIPVWICDFNMEISMEQGDDINDEFDSDSILLYANPIENIPIEILHSGKSAVHRYFKNKH